jgi:chaperonin GroEL
MTAAIGTDLRRGFDTLGELLARTLGPARGIVLNDLGRGNSEALDNSATLIRRVTSLAGTHRSNGAAIMREMVRTVGLRCGDGGATAAVIAGAMVGEAGKAVAAGANPVLVRRGIGRGVECACAAIKANALPPSGEAEIAALATTVTDDPPLGQLIGELLDAVGPEGAVQVARHHGTELLADYVAGARWRARPATRSVVPSGSNEVALTDPAVIVADLTLDHWSQVRPLLEVTLTLPGRPPLLLIASDIGDSALAAFNLNDVAGTVVSAPAVLATPRTHHSDDLADIAMLTGATVLSEAGTRPDNIGPDHVGSARQALLQRGYVTINDGHGDPATIAERAAALRTRSWELDNDRTDDELRERMWLRQARLLGRVAAVTVGAQTTHQLEARVESARKAIRLVRAAMRDGMVAGGGVALLDSIAAVRQARDCCQSEDESRGLDAVCAGLEAPFLQLVSNSGLFEPRVALHRARDLGPGYGVDLEGGDYVHMWSAGIRDVAGVAVTAVEAAGTTAGILVSAEVVAGRG